MTREEAIQELQNCKGLIQQDGQDYLDDRDIPLLDMAIEALSEPSVSIQPKTIANNCDLISRADAMSKCKNAENELTDEAERKGLRVARFIIGEMPSACKEDFYFEVEPPKGYNYCPSCGARMENTK